MTRVTSGPHTRQRHKRVLKAVRGHRGSRNKRYRLAKESLLHALAYSTIGRKLKKRENRSLAIIRINAAARENGMTYNELIHGLKLANVSLDRKSLSDLAVREPSAFSEVVQTAKTAVGA